MKQETKDEIISYLGQLADSEEIFIIFDREIKKAKEEEKRELIEIKTKLGNALLFRNWESILKIYDYLGKKIKEDK